MQDDATIKMSDAELRCVREYLGLTQEWLADHLDVVPRTIRRWEMGQRAIPEAVALEMERLALETGRYVQRMTQVFEQHTPGRSYTAFRSDGDVEYVMSPLAYTEAPLPAGWYRRTAARVWEATNCPIEYGDAS
jgi:DNA-binding XRE family transcriptional regulator